MVRAAQAKCKWKQDQSQMSAPKLCQHQDLSDMADLFMGDIIQKCWTVDGYWDMKDVCVSPPGSRNRPSFIKI
ncbi:hypothetical protein EMCG_09005 [[Emmonsia] crescens]|uniref:Uncharacterized protein n=1 Tax=[Emmonsia] crescens TaxID=73230 RepID=A0A0G2J3M5_9EURO|nr:hypothetical protein EMCG_09005 [Emmonsia crescens UAMH 3008]